MKIEKLASPLTLYDYEKELKKFIDFITDNNILDFQIITTSLIREYFYFAKESRSLGQASISKIIAIIKSFFNFLEEEEIIIKNPSRKIRVPKKINRIPKIMTKYEIEMLINSMKFAPSRSKKTLIRDKLVISTLYYTGIRRNELLKLNWDDISLSKNTLIVRSGKGNCKPSPPMNHFEWFCVSKH